MAIVHKNPQNISQCNCGSCPSYNQCARGKKEGLFCAKEQGKSTCTFKQNGCVCGECPIFKNYHLKTGYYCMNGSADKVG